MDIERCLFDSSDEDSKDFDEIANEADGLDQKGNGNEQVEQCNDVLNNELVEYKDEGVDDIIHPSLGMEFESVEEALSFYKDSARRLGFGVCKRTNHKKGGLKYHYAFSCNKYKKVGEKDCAMPSVPERNRPVVAGECKA